VELGDYRVSPQVRAWGVTATLVVLCTIVLFGPSAHAHDMDEQEPNAEDSPPTYGSSSAPSSSSSTDSSSSSSSTYESTTVGDRNEDPAERWTIDTEEVVSQDRTTADKLRRVPGVVVQRHSTEGKGEQFLVRGFDAGHGTDVELTLDGVPLNAPSHIHGQGYIDLSWIPSAALSSIDWQPGSFRLDQGAFATAGTIELQTGDFENHEVGYRTSSTFRQHIWGRYIDKEEDDRWIATEFVHDRGYGEDREVLRGNFLASTSLVHSEDVHLSAQLGASATDFDVPSFLKRDDIEAGRVDYYDGYDVPSEGEAQTTWLALPFTVRTENRWRIDGFASLDFRRFYLLSNTTGFLINPDVGDTLEIEDTRTAIRGRVKARKTLNGKFQLRTFSEASTTLLTQSEYGTDLEGQRLSTNRDLDAAITTVSAGVGVRWFPHIDWTVDLMFRTDYLRYDVNDRVEGGVFHDDGWIPSPRAAIDWKPTDSVKLRAAYGRGFRPWEAQAIVPEVEPDVPTDGLEEAQPEPTITDHVELSAGFQTNWLNLRVAAFGIFIKDEYYFDHVSRESRSLGATRRLGGELAATLKPVEWWRFDLTMLAVDARFREREDDTVVPNVPAISGQVSTSFGPFAGFEISSSLLFVSRRELLYDSEAAGYAVVDAEVSWRRGGFRIWLGIENIGDTEFSEAEYAFASAFYPEESRSQIPRLHIAAGPPRIVHAGVSYDF
jgi:outer membrane receptor protein involved in Fe transport